MGSSVTTTSTGTWSFGSLAVNATYFVIETNPANFVSTNALPGTGSSTTATKVDNDQIKVVLTNVGGVSNTGSDFLDTAAVKSLSLTKSASPATYDHVGQAITYTYVIKNTGNVTLGPTQFTVTDDHIGSPLGTAFNCGGASTTLAPNGTVTCTATYAITQADLDAGTVTNTATAHGAGRDSAPATATATATQTKSMTVEKSSATTSISATGAVTYSYLLTNTGNVTLTGIALVDNHVDAAPVCVAVTLAPLATTTCSAVYTVTQADLDAGANIVNSVTASSTQGATATDSLSIPVVQTKSMTVEKSSATTSISATGAVTYSYLLTNTGNVTLTGIALVDNHVDAAPVCVAVTLAPLATTTCSAVYTVTQADLDAGANIVNSVTASSTQGATATDSLSIPVVQTKSMTVEKSSATTSISATGAVTYSYLLTNTGNVTLTGIALVDNHVDAAPVCVAVTLAPLATTTCSAVYTVTQADLDAGANIVNSVTASSTQGATATDSLSIPVVQTKSMTVEKSSATTSISATGAVTYSYLLTNTGNVTLTGIALVDNHVDAAPVCVAVTLAPLATTTCSAVYTVTQADLDAGANIVNSVTASSTQGATATDSLSIPVVQTKSMTVEKSSATTSISATGAVTYTLHCSRTPATSPLPARSRSAMTTSAAQRAHRLHAAADPLRPTRRQRAPRPTRSPRPTSTSAPSRMSHPCRRAIPTRPATP